MSKPKEKDAAKPGVLQRLVDLLKTPSNQFRSHGITFAQVSAAETILIHAKEPEHKEVAINFLLAVVNGENQSDVTSRVKAAKILLDGGHS